MSYVEVTGQSCSGKSHFIALESSKGHAFVFDKTPLSQLKHFLLGIKYLGIRRIAMLILWSSQESVSLFFKANIFRNAVLKFGVYVSNSEFCQDSDQTCLIDEGLSHLAFLFLNTDPRKIIEFSSSELSEINVIFLKTPGDHVIAERLNSRGHKRLKFVTISDFVKRNSEIESIMLSQYPNLCNHMRSL